MYSCPVCDNNDVVGQATCSCGTDLTLLRHLDAAIDAWFNRGLAALAACRKGEALEWFSACCIARPTDAEAHRLRGEVWIELDHTPEARAALERAETLDPGSLKLAPLREAIAIAETKSSGKEKTTSAGRSHARRKTKKKNVKTRRHRQS